MTRKKAFLTHLAMSVTLVVALVLVFITFLFPFPYFIEDGGWNGIKLIAAIDVVIGPLLTFVVFSPGKRRSKLAFDLTVIGIAQLTALTFGLWTVYTHSTQSVLYLDGSFYTVDTSLGQSFNEKYQALIGSSSGRPFYGVIDLPDDEDARKEMRAEALRTGLTLLRRAELLVPLKDSTAGLEIAQSLRKLEKLYPDRAVLERIETWVRQKGGLQEDYYFVPLQCRYGVLLSVVRKEDRSIAGFIRDLPPYKH